MWIYDWTGFQRLWTTTTGFEMAIWGNGVRTICVTALSSVGRPPVANALSQRWAMPSTSLSAIHEPHVQAEITVAYMQRRKADANAERCILSIMWRIGDQGVQSNPCAVRCSVLRNRSLGEVLNTSPSCILRCARLRDVGSLSES